MQNAYVGDIGDYGKYGLLRKLAKSGVKLGVNWYAVIPTEKGKQEDGKYTEYLQKPEEYRHYDSELFDRLAQIVVEEQDRRIQRIEELALFPSLFYSAPLHGGSGRKLWHSRALEQTAAAELVFLDPDNGVESEKMHQKGTATEKHVCWSELRDYYSRGQNVLLYQHRPQRTRKEQCVQSVLNMQARFLHADSVRLLEFPRYTNRFYFFFLHKEYVNKGEAVCHYMAEHWAGMCSEIPI